MAKAEAPTASVVVDDTRRRLGKVGVWLLDVFMARESTAEVERREVARIEKLEPVHGRRPSRDLEGPRGGPVGHDDGAAGEPAMVADMAHAQAGNHGRHCSKV
jgi:hypothetical protein